MLWLSRLALSCLVWNWHHFWNKNLEPAQPPSRQWNSPLEVCPICQGSGLVRSIYQFQVKEVDLVFFSSRSHQYFLCLYLGLCIGFRLCLCLSLYLGLTHPVYLLIIYIWLRAVLISALCFVFQPLARTWQDELPRMWQRRNCQYEKTRATRTGPRNNPPELFFRGCGRWTCHSEKNARTCLDDTSKWLRKICVIPTKMPSVWCVDRIVDLIYLNWKISHWWVKARQNKTRQDRIRLD